MIQYTLIGVRMLRIQYPLGLKSVFGNEDFF